MTDYRFYVRGHGGEHQHPLPPSRGVPIDVVTVGTFGCTMTGGVADDCIYGHKDVSRLEREIVQNRIIYWNEEERTEYRRSGRLHFTQPTVTITSYDSLHINLALFGDRDLGECGLCYWNAALGELVWVRSIDHDEALPLRDILEIVRRMLQPEDTAQIFWTACQSGGYWRDDGWQVARNPTLSD